MAVISNDKGSALKLDMYDKKIIFHLSQNSRMPISELAKKLRISSQRTQYKVDRLTTELLEPAAFMNFPLLEIPSYIIYCKSLSEETINALMQNEEVYFCMESIGEYRWVLNVVTTDISSFCKNFLGNYHIEVQPILRSIPDDYNPFKLSIKPLALEKNGDIALGHKDYLLLEALSIKPVASVLELSSITGLDRKTITKKITFFLKDNIIQKFRYGINIFKLGNITYVLRIGVVPNNKHKILEYIRSNNYSGFVFETYEGFTMHYLPPSHTELMEFLSGLEKVDETIEITVMQNTERFKVDLVPGSVKNIFKERQKI